MGLGKRQQQHKRHQERPADDRKRTSPQEQIQETTKPPGGGFVCRVACTLLLNRLCGELHVCKFDLQFCFSKSPVRRMTLHLDTTEAVYPAAKHDSMCINHLIQ